MQTKYSTDEVIDIDKNSEMTYKKYLKKITPLAIPFEGRTEIIKSMKSVLYNPEIPNVLLLADAGSGKTTLVKKLSMIDLERDYYELDLAGVISEYSMAKMIEGIREISSTSTRHMVVFIDEFHRIADVDATSSEEMLSLLAENGIFFKVSFIAATTSKWFYEKLQSNEPLVTRFIRIQLPELNSKETLSVLSRRAEQYEKDYGCFIPSDILGEIVKFTTRYMPADAQPRKSIKILSSLVGEYRSDNQEINHDLLRTVFKTSLGVDIDFKIDIDKVFNTIKKRVFGQEIALETIKSWLYNVVAGMNDLSRPLCSFLFAGPTGVGKTEFAKALAEGMYGSESDLIRFDMSEYPAGDATASNRFRHRVAESIFNKPFSVLLLDEIEKTDKSVTNLFLQILDDARLSDKYGRVIPFNNTIVIMTTNAGSEVFREKAKTINRVDLRLTTMRSKKNDLRELSQMINDSLASMPTFETAVLGRIDAIVAFLSLKRFEIVDIIKDKVTGIADKVFDKKGKWMYIDHKFYPYFINDIAKADSESGGVRDIIRIVMGDLIAFVSEQIVLNNAKLSDDFVVELGGTTTFMSNSTNMDKTEFLLKEVYSTQAISESIKKVKEKIIKIVGYDFKIFYDHTDIALFIKTEEVKNLDRFIKEIMIESIESSPLPVKTLRLAPTYVNAEKDNDELHDEETRDLIEWGRSEMKVAFIVEE